MNLVFAHDVLESERRYAVKLWSEVKEVEIVSPFGSTNLWRRS